MSDELICSECGQEIDPPADPMQNLMVCPACGNQFFIDITPTDEPSNGDDEAAREALDRKLEREQNRERDLDSLRIRALLTERRAMYRTRSFFILGVAGCVIAFYELLDRLLRRGSFNRLGQLAMAILAIGCVIGAVFFARKIVELQRELRKPMLEEPDHDPDFEPLRDGSQTWKDLEEMHRQRDQE